MTAKRLIEVYLPNSTVDRLTDALARYGDLYGDRSAFVNDAIENLLVRLAAREDDQRNRPRTAPNRFAPDEVAARVAVRTPVAGARTTSGIPVNPDAQPTFGLHNHDWPTLWAASELGRKPLNDDDAWSHSGPGTAAGGLPVDLAKWAIRLGDYAWDLAVAASGTDIKLAQSGFPSPRTQPDERLGPATGGTPEFDRTTMKRQRKDATNRFRTHFVGHASKRGALEGPLLALHLVGIDPSDPKAVMLTPEGIDLLTELDGLMPSPDDPARPEHRRAFLAHLARWAPADFAFLADLIRAIDSGTTQRSSLKDALRERHRDPEGAGDSTLSTNVAGFIARGREWGLIDPKQGPGRVYLLTPDAVSAIETAERDRSTR